MTTDGLCFVALGDSTTVGIGDPTAGPGWRGWSRLLATELARTHRLTYRNFAVSGATTATLSTDQLPQALQLRPQLASVIVGVNDTMKSTWDPVRVYDGIHRCVGALTEAGALVLMLRFHDHGAVFGLPGALRRPLLRRIDALNRAYDAAHASYGGILLDLAQDPVVFERAFWSIDRLHPSELGHRRLASEFALALRARGIVVGCPSMAGSGAPQRWQEWWWLATKGMPWLGRRTRDLLPWAVRLTAAELTCAGATQRSRSPGPRMLPR